MRNSFNSRVYSRMSTTFFYRLIIFVFNHEHNRLTIRIHHASFASSIIKLLILIKHPHTYIGIEISDRISPLRPLYAIFISTYFYYDLHNGRLLIYIHLRLFVVAYPTLFTIDNKTTNAPPPCDFIYV